MYYKRNTGAILVRKSVDIPDWVQWTHHSEGKTHCEECLILDGCWFLKNNAPTWPHHPFCHCTLDPIDYAVVVLNIATQSDYSKYDPYLFDPGNCYKHGKNKAFESWGYTIADAQWLKNEIERQAREKYASGEYTLGKLDIRGQRVNIRVTIPRNNEPGDVSFITGWMVLPNGKLKLNTPYGGK